MMILVMCHRSHTEMPWMASNRSLKAAESILADAKFPPQYGSAVKTLFSTPGKCKSVDWLHLAGPLGMYIIGLLDIQASYKTVFQRFLKVLYQLRGYNISVDTLPHLKTELVEVLALMESKLPLDYASINQHCLVHLPSIIALHGPLPYLWM
jgi:hypothetical protein